MSENQNLLIDVAAGQSLVRAGESGNTLFLVESGTIALHDGDSPKPALRRLGPGSLFGESAALGKGNYLHSATAEVDSRVLPLDKESVAQLIRANPEAALALLVRMAESMDVLVQRAAAAPAAASGSDPSTAEATQPAPEEPRTERPFTPPSEVTAAPPAAVVSGDVVIALSIPGGEAIVLDPSLNAYLVGRPDPQSGAIPEVNLGPFDVHRSLSRRHARIMRQGDALLLREETGVANGTFLNDRRLASGESVPFQPGDKLRFGAVEVDVVAIQTAG
jgi:CRP-like cAMP-binding protein